MSVLKDIRKKEITKEVIIKAIDTKCCHYCCDYFHKNYNNKQSYCNMYEENIYATSIKYVETETKRCKQCITEFGV